MRTFIPRLMVILFLMVSLCGWAQKSQKPAYSIDLTVTDKDSKEPIIMATIQLQPAGIVAVTNADAQRSTYFDLQGRRIAEPTKGLYINNAKKYIAK